MRQTLQTPLKKWITSAISTFLLFFLFGIQISIGQETLVNYPFNEELDVSPSDVPFGISVSDFQISSGSVNFGSAQEGSWETDLPYAQGNSGWDSTSAEDAKNFFFTMNPSGVIQLDELSFEWRVTSTGPSAISVIVDGDVIDTINAPVDETTISTFDLSGVDEITSETTIRIAGWDNGSRTTSGGGQFRVNDINLTGTLDVASVNIPYTQDFRNFDFADDVAVTEFGIENEWQLNSTEGELEYDGDWGSGTSAGLRGDDNVLGYQHTGSTGIFSTSLILQNNTESTIENLTISYDGMVERDDQGRTPKWTVFVNDSEVAELSYSTEDGIDKTITHTLNDINLEDGDFVEITWESDRGDGSDSSRQIGIGHVSVSAAGEHVLTLNGTEGFRMFSAPTEVSLKDFLDPIWTQGDGVTGSDDQTGDPNVFIWDTTDEGNWSPADDLSSTQITAGTGLLVYVFDDDNPYESESSQGFPKTLTVSGAENSPNISPAVNETSDGFTFLGNPFSSAIDVNELTTEDLTGTIYIWDVNDNDGDGGGDSGSNDPGAGSWKTWNGTVGDISNGIIRPFQGFFVQTVESPEGTPSVTFPESAKTTGGSFLGKQMDQEPIVVRLQLDGDELRSSTWLQFSENGSLDRQVPGDALNLDPLSNRYAQLSTAKNDETLFNINHLPLSADQYSIPVFISTTDGGEYVLTATDIELPEEFGLTFHDHENNTTTQIDSDFEYVLQMEAEKREKTLSTLSRLQTGPVAAKADGEHRFSISVNSNQTEDNGQEQVPDEFALNQNYPNPFGPSTVISYEIPEDSHVRITIYDLLARELAVLIDGPQQAGGHDVTWNASQYSSGVYLYQLDAGGQSITRQMTLIK